MNVSLGNESLGDRIWHQHNRAMMPEYVRVIGRVIGKVFIRDIAKEVRYNQVVDIIIGDAKKSDDLVRAIAQKWVDVVYGKEFLDKKKYSTELNRTQQQPVTSVVNMQQQTVDLSEVKNLASQIAQDAADKSVSSIRDMLNEFKEAKGSNLDAQQIVDELVAKLPKQSGTKTIDDSAVAADSEGVFINLDDDKELKTNIQGDLGAVTKSKSKKAKMTIKKLKHINSKGDSHGNA